MSTRALICRQIDNVNIEFIYCGCDGSIGTNGKILFNSYGNKKKLQELFAPNKDVMVLGETIEETHFYDGDEEEVLKKTILSNLMVEADNRGVEYIYLYGLDRKWRYAKRYSEITANMFARKPYWKWLAFKDLEEAIRQEESKEYREYENHEEKKDFYARCECGYESVIWKLDEKSLEEISTLFPACPDCGEDVDYLPASYKEDN